MSFLKTLHSLHSRWAGEMQLAYPDALIYSTRKMAALLHKTHGITVDRIIPSYEEEHVQFEWSNEIEYKFIPSLSHLDEVVFLHKASGTLVITDLCFNFDPAEVNTVFRTYLQIFNGLRPLTVTPMFRSAVSDRKLMKKSLDEVLQWDFDKVHVCHTKPQLEKAKEIFINETYRLLTTKP